MGRRTGGKRAKKEAERTMRVTWPGGRVTIEPDDGRSYPPGTMLMWDVDVGGGRREMRWTITGGGWPFDD